MGSTRVQRRRRRIRALHVPVWYYVLLGIVAVAGIVAIILSTRSSPPRPMDARDLVGPGDHPLGARAAPVTIIEWGSFT